MPQPRVSLSKCRCFFESDAESYATACPYHYEILLRAYERNYAESVERVLHNAHAPRTPLSA